MPHYEHLFTPIQIGNMTVPNRICHVPTDVSSSNADGSVSERDIHHHSQIAKGGAGLIIVGATSPDGLCNIPGTTLIDDGSGNYVLADKSGKPFVSFNAEPEEDGVPNVFLLMFMKRVLQEYTVTLTASEGGSITGDETVRWSRDALYTITPDEGYTLAALYLDGEEVEPTLTLTLDRVKANRTIEAVFAPIEE